MTTSEPEMIMLLRGKGNGLLLAVVLLLTVTVCLMVSVEFHAMIPAAILTGFEVTMLLATGIQIGIRLDGRNQSTRH